MKTLQWLCYVSVTYQTQFTCPSRHEADRARLARTAQPQTRTRRQRRSSGFTHALDML